MECLPCFALRGLLNILRLFQGGNCVFKNGPDKMSAYLARSVRLPRPKYLQLSILQSPAIAVPQGPPSKFGLLLITDFIKSKKGGLKHGGHEAMTSDQLPTTIAPARASRMLTAAEFHQLADVPPEVEWFRNLTNPSTRRAYETAVKDFMRFTGIRRPEEFRIVTRAHIIAWRDELARREPRRQHDPAPARVASIAV